MIETMAVLCMHSRCVVTVTTTMNPLSLPLSPSLSLPPSLSLLSLSLSPSDSEDAGLHGSESVPGGVQFPADQWRLTLGV